MKRLRNFMLFAVITVAGFHALANSLDDYAKFAVAKNLVANQALLFCKGPKLTVDMVVKNSKVIKVDEVKVRVVSSLKSCHFSSVRSAFFYKDDVTKIEGMSARKPLPKSKINK